MEEELKELYEELGVTTYQLEAYSQLVESLRQNKTELLIKIQELTNVTEPPESD